MTDHRSSPDRSLYLRTWEQDQRVSAIRQLAIFQAEDGNDLVQARTPSDTIWRDHPPQMHQFLNWLCQRPRLAALEQAFFTNADEPFAAEFSSAVEVMRVLVDQGTNAERGDTQ